MLKTAPTGWVYIKSGDITVRWQRGDTVAYIFDGKQLETIPGKAPKTLAIDTVPVITTGWFDISNIRMVGEKWATVHSKRCPRCGRAA